MWGAPKLGGGGAGGWSRESPKMGEVLRRRERNRHGVLGFRGVNGDPTNWGDPLTPLASPRPLDQVKRKILVLDLDETLIHSHHDGVLRPTVRPGTPPDFILKVRGDMGVPRGRVWGSQVLGCS